MYKVLVVREWAREDDLLHCMENLPPITSYRFRVKCRNRLGWSPMSEESDVATTEAGPPGRPAKPFATMVTPEMVQVHWHPAIDNGARIFKYVLRGKRVGGIVKELYADRGLSYVDSVEGGCQYLYEVRAINKMGKSGWSDSFIVQVPAEVDPNATYDVSDELRKGHLWLECWDRIDERQFWFHTITGSRQLSPPPEWVEHKEQLKLERERNAHLRKEKLEEDQDPAV